MGADMTRSIRRFVFSADKVRQVTKESEGGAERWLAVSDVPIGFELSADEERGLLLIQVLYSSGETESLRWIRHAKSPLRLAVGEHSARLLRIEIRVTDDLNFDAHRTWERLAAGLHELRQTARYTGPRMNYAATEAGLTSDDTGDHVSPAWLVGALERLRRERGSVIPNE
jgi:hypothetical protein